MVDEALHGLGRAFPEILFGAREQTPLGPRAREKERGQFSCDQGAVGHIRVVKQEAAATSTQLVWRDDTQARPAALHAALCEDIETSSG
ncbi:MAG: hypothetical protein AB7J28_06845 [Hyphomonadaceae bacterium]